MRRQDFLAGHRVPDHHPEERPLRRDEAPLAPLASTTALVGFGPTGRKTFVNDSPNERTGAPSARLQTCSRYLLSFATTPPPPGRNASTLAELTFSRLVHQRRAPVRASCRQRPCTTPRVASTDPSGDSTGEKGEPQIVARCEFAEFGHLQEALEKRGIHPISATHEYICTTPMELPEAQAHEVLEMIDQLEQNDDVQNVYHSLA